MLNVLRKNLKSLKWILVLVSLSFVMYLGAYFDRDSLLGRPRAGANQDWAAYVGDTKISSLELERRVGNLEETYRQQLQGQFESLRKALRLPQAALNQLVTKELMLREARRVGLSVSPEEIRVAILSHPAFRSEKGHFIGKERYEQLLAANNLSVAGFEKSMADDILVEKWQAMVTGPALVTDQEIEKTYKQTADTLSFDYVSIPPGQWSPPEPKEPEARAYFEQNAARYRKSDGRTGSYVLIEASSAASVTPEEVRKYYDANQASFKRPEQRRARHILLKVDPSAGDAADSAARAKAEELVRRLKAGEDFAALAKQYSQDTASAQQGGDLGWFGHGVMVPEFEKAAFSSRPGDIVGPVKSSFGYHIIQVGEERPAGVAPFDEVKETIQQQLLAPKRREALSAKVRELLGVANDPAKFEEAARAKGYTVRSTGVLLPDSDFPGLKSQPELLQTIFNTPVGKIARPIQLPEGVVLLKVTGTVPAAGITFDQARSKVLEDLLREKARQAAEHGARQQLAAAGGTLEGLASKLKLAVQKAGPVRKGDPLPGLPADPSIEQTLFQAPTGGPPLVLAAADSKVVVTRVTGRGTANPADLAARRDDIRRQLEEQNRNTVLGAFLNQLRRTTSIRTNDALLDRLNS